MTTSTHSDIIFEGLQYLAKLIDGDLRIRQIDRFLYAQDASIYSEEPIGVVCPKSTSDVVHIVNSASNLNIGLIPRGAGTSLAGQCVGNGLVVDLGRYMNRILHFDPILGIVDIEPGVILDDLNDYVRDAGLMVGPDTSTANRCMIGGMVGNNSCGSHSIYYGTTRDHVAGLEVVMSDGSVEWIEDWNDDAYNEKRNKNNMLANAIKEIEAILDSSSDAIEAAFPRRDVVRRNSGYALDALLFRKQEGKPFALQQLLCGSEGTLALVTKIRLRLVPRPKHSLLVCVHFENLNAALSATVEAVKHHPAAVELMDDKILEQTKTNLVQSRNRFFVQGDPKAILVVEFYDDDDTKIEKRAAALVDEFREKNLGFAYPIVRPPDDARVWSLRKAGLGLLMGIPKKRKAIAVVEDTSVPVDFLPEYIQDFQRLMAALGTDCVYYGHASVGELHLRPELDLKDPREVELMETISFESMRLVRKYRGSVSGEHGDGRVRGAQLAEFFGSDVYELLRRVKYAFDPNDIFNPNKIVDTKPVDTDLRYPMGVPVPEIKTYYDFSHDGGLIRSVEKCNGAGVCRKKVVSKGTMCPSYRATLEEKDSTRGRSNVFRHVLLAEHEGAFSSDEIKEALDLCLACKACKSECPANVDMARLKSEFLQQYFDVNGVPLSAKLFGHYANLSKLASIFPRLANAAMGLPISKSMMRTVMGVTPKRSLPPYAAQSFNRWWKDARHALPSSPEDPSQVIENTADSVWLYVDPFINYTEPEIAIAAVALLRRLGVEVEVFPVHDDGRTQFSKGLVKDGRDLVNKNLRHIAPLLAEYPNRPVLGIEPSALLSFVDEYPNLCDDDVNEVAVDLASRAQLVEDWLAAEQSKGRYLGNWEGAGEVVLHGHCHQKSLVGLSGVVATLERAGYEVRALPTGCCGMAGSFGYEESHYEVSMAVGEQVLFPELRGCEDGVMIAAGGTSCRHQIAHGVKKVAQHPIVLLERAYRH